MQLRDDPVLGYCDEEATACRSAHPNAAWRQVALSRARRARHELLCAWEDPHRERADRWGEDTAELILRAKDAALCRSSPRAWFEGRHQEEAWLSLHQANAQIVKLLPREDLLAQADTLLAKARRALGEDDPRVRGAESLLRRERPSVAKVRLRLSALAVVTYDALDDRYAQSRGYRNRLLRLIGLALVGGILGLAAAAMSQLNFNAAHEAGPGLPALWGWKAMLPIMLFGCTGALVIAIPPLARANGVRNPFGLPWFQLLLKLAMGPLFAVVGVLVLQSGVIPVQGLKPATDLQTLFVWATLFGAAQQSVTRFIDQRVTGLLSDTPSSPSASEKPGARKR